MLTYRISGSLNLILKRNLSLSRLQNLKYGDMSQDQKNLHDEILSGPRTQIAGPMHTWFLNPSYGSLIEKVGAFCRYETSIEPRLSELAIIIVARHWNANVEWFAHSEIAIKSGILQETVEAIELNKRPDFKKEDEALIFDITKSILDTKGLTDELFKRAEDTIGKTSLLDLTAIIGYYCNVAIQLNVFEIPSDDGQTLEVKA
jgi:4-carboxymuconolactone decarboxylase